MNKVIFLTGATGLVGSNLIPRILKNDSTTRLVLLIRANSDNEAEQRLNPHFSFEWSEFGFGLGFVGATKGIHYPSLKSPEEHPEEYFEGKNVADVKPSYHLRLGNPQYIYASVSHLENIPLISGGGYLNYGIGTEAIPYLSLWAGYGDKKPFEKNSFLLKAGLKLSRNLSLNCAYRSGKSIGNYTDQPIKENAFSVRLNYRFFRK